MLRAGYPTYTFGGGGTICPGSRPACYHTLSEIVTECLLTHSMLIKMYMHDVLMYLQSLTFGNFLCGKCLLVTTDSCHFCRILQDLATVPICHCWGLKVFSFMPSVFLSSLINLCWLHEEVLGPRLPTEYYTVKILIRLGVCPGLSEY